MCVCLVCAEILISVMKPKCGSPNHYKFIQHKETEKVSSLSDMERYSNLEAELVLQIIWMQLLEFTASRRGKEAVA